jgi:hypothetical protein
MKKILFFVLMITGLFGEITLPKSGDNLSSKPTIYWEEFGNNSYCLELSLDKFDTIFYSTCRDSGISINNTSYSIPSALWSYLKNKSSYYLRVSSESQSTDYITLHSQQIQSVASALTTSSSTDSSDSGDFFGGFSEQTKLQNAQNSPYLENELLITLKSGYTSLPSSIDEYAFVIEKITTALGSVIYRTQVSSDISLSTAISNLQSLNEVDIVQPNYVRKKEATTTYKSEPQMATLQWGVQAINAPTVWDNGYSGSGVTVAVLDTGINANHIDFSGKVILGPDYGDGDNDPTDTDGHGTHVASIIAANADSNGAIGVAPDAKILAIKVFANGGGTSSSITAKAIDYAIASGAKVINMSLGSANVFADLPDILSTDSLYLHAISKASDNGVVVVTSAGNDTTNMIGYPRGSSDAIMVSALRSDDKLTPFSSHGGSVSISAPGYNIYAADYSTTEGYVFKSGTSMAAPIVSGAVALLLEKDSTLKPSEVKDILQNSAKDLGASGYDSLYGYGKIDIASAMGFSVSSDLTPPIVVSIEADTTTLKVVFNKDMLADGSTNAIDTKANLGGSGSLATFIANSTTSYDSTSKTLTITNNSDTLTADTTLAIFIAKNVVDTDGNIIRGNYTSATGYSYVKDTVPDYQAVQFTVSKSAYSYDDYAHTVATDDGNLIVYFNQPVTQASAETKTNYTLVHYPAGNSSVAKSTFLANAPTTSSHSDSATEDLSDNTLTYDSSSNSLTISGLSLTKGATYGLKIANTTLINSITNNSVKDAIPTIYGVVEEASSTTLSVVSTSMEDTVGNASHEWMSVKFSSDVNATEAMDISKYSLVVNGTNIDLSNAYVVYDAGYKRSFLFGLDLYSYDTQSYTITVNNIHKNNGDSIGGTNSVTGTTPALSATSYYPSLKHVTASTNAIQAYFSTLRQIDSATLIPANITLTSGGNTITLDTTNYDIAYDNKAYMLNIRKSDGSAFLNAGDTLEITFNTSVLSKYGSSSTPFSSTYNSATTVVGSATYTFAINTAPTITIANSINVKTNTPLTLSYTATDNENDTITPSIRTQATHGTASISSGNIVYTPTTDYTGTDSFTVAFSDGTVTVNKTIAVTVADSINNTPVPTIATTLTTNEDTAGTMTFSVSDADNDTITTTIKTDGSNGSASISGTTITYTPNANYHGSDTFVVNFTDGTANVEKTVNVTVNSVNDNPAITLASSTITTDEDNAGSTTFSYTDIDGDTVNATVKTNATNGSATISGTTITYTPNANYHGSDSFVINFSDGVADIEKTISVTVNSVNDNPVINLSATSITTNEDTAGNVTYTYTDIDGNTVSATIKTNGSNGSATISGTTITYTPNANYNGNDSIVVTFTDGAGYTNDVTIPVTVNSVNDLPTITMNTTITTNEDTNGTLSFSVTDIDGDSVTNSVSTNASNGTINITNNTINYKPNENYNGTDTFTMSFVDTNGGVVQKVVTVNITAINDTPVITMDTNATINEDTTANFVFSATDVDGDSISATIVNAPTDGNATINGTTITYTPNANYYGSDSFDVRFSDGVVNVDKNITVTITSVNDLPTITISDVLSVNKNDSATIEYTIADVETNATIAMTTLPTNGQAVLNDSNITYTPTTDYTGNDSLVLTITDSDGGITTKTISIKVLSISTTTDEDGNTNIGIAFKDDNGDDVTFTTISALEDINQTVSATGSITNSVEVTSSENKVAIVNLIDVNGTVQNTSTITKADNTVVENIVSAEISDTNTTIKENGDIEVMTPPVTVDTGSKIVAKMVSSNDGYITTTATITKSDGSVRNVSFTQYSNATVKLRKNSSGKMVVDSKFKLPLNSKIVIK